MISVVVPVFNHRDFVLSCLSSAVQSPIVTEVLVVDDGSSDGCERILAGLAQSQPKITVLPNPERRNLGAHVRLNQLVRAATQEWIAVLNSDDQFVPGRFEAIERDLRSGRSDLFFGDLAVIDAADGSLGLRRAVDNNENPWSTPTSAHEAAADEHWLELLLSQNIIATTTNIVFSKAIFENVGGFRPFRYCHDWDFALRAALCGKISYRPLLMSRYRIHGHNTIGESRSRVEAEVFQMMLDLRDEFPILDTDPALEQAIQQNRYVFPRRTNWLEIVRQADPSFVVAESTLSNADLDVSFVDAPSQDGPPSGSIYAPGPAGANLTTNDLRSLRLAMAVRCYDMLFISRTLQPAPAVATASLRDMIVYCRGWMGAGTGAITARLIRLMPGEQEPVPLSDLISSDNLVLDHALKDVASTQGPWRPPVPLPHEGLGRLSDKPVVFVFPIFLAVGGAERLVIETMRHLASRYHFVIVNTEPLQAFHGSLHAEALVHAEVYDLAELMRQDDRLTAVELLKRHYQPAVVWITNGSPWQVAHAEQLRSIFKRTAMVDNQVYDHEHGWINSFADPHVRAADRFVAINGRIRTRMIEEFKIGPDKIDLVYHGANISHLASRELCTSDDRLRRRAQFGLGEAGLVFGMIGRLTAQKRPQDLIQLAARAQASGHPHQFIWAGPGELRDDLQTLCDSLQLRNFTLLPPLRDVQPLYEALDGLIVTSEFEGLPFVVLEALALGVPVLSTPVGAIEEVLLAYGAGRISGPPGDLDALERAFELFVHDLPDLRSLASDRRLAFIEQFSSERMAREYEESWMKATVGKRSSRRGVPEGEREGAERG